MDENFKRAIIMEHYTKPKNRGLVNNDKYLEVHNASESCIDDLKIQMLIEDNIIKDICFDGVACTISTASTSIISDLIKGKTREEALRIIENYYAMLNEEAYDEELLEEANAFETLYKQANRIKCGLIGINAMKEIIDKSYEK